MAMPTASNYQPWGTLPVPQTCFQLCGTKRKATPSEGSNASEQVHLTTAVKRHCLHLSTRQRLPAGQPHPLQQPLTNPPSSPWHHHKTGAPSPVQSDHVVGNPSQVDFHTAFQQQSLMQVEATDNVQSMCVSPAANGFCDNTAVHSRTPTRMDTGTAVHGLNNNNQPQTSQSEESLHQGNCQRLFEQRNQNRLYRLEDVDFESNDYWDVPHEHHLLKMADEIERARIAMETDDTPDLHQQQYSSVPTSESTLIPGLDVHSTGNHVRCYCKPSWEGLLEPVSYI